MQYGSDGIKIRREEETMYQKLMTCLESVREKTDFKPEIALVLGSGLGDFAERIQIEQIIKYTDIEEQAIKETETPPSHNLFTILSDNLEG